MQALGQNIRTFRQINKLSAEKLAQKANISSATIFALEQGKAHPSVTTLLKIADALDLHLEVSFRPKEQGQNR
jgi:transcriptional regulator with XRE-family HTH domain